VGRLVGYLQGYFFLVLTPMSSNSNHLAGLPAWLLCRLLAGSKDQPFSIFFRGIQRFPISYYETHSYQHVRHLVQDCDIAS